MGASVQNGAGGGSGGRRRGRARARQRAAPMAEINVTPFVDVMLVLLIIFMVAAPLLTVGVPVELPETAANPLPSEQEQPLTVTVMADGRLAIQDSEVPPNELVPLLRAVLAERDSQTVYLRGDAALAYGRVMEVMGALNAAGFRDIGLVTEPGGPRFDGPSGPSDGTDQ